ncbi:MAG: O-antigen ligase family protein [Endomicrobia bacterium]|nr:O-antigen ligase family protein [Endomicrobiia bacterium]MDW8055309.1 O-antigen ligase family protein [Elusimicrobiota bacterium]
MSKIQYLTILLILLISAFILSRMVVIRPSILLIGILLAFTILLVSFFSPQVGLAFLVFSMLLSPEIKLAEVPGRDVVVRIDDLLIFAVFFGWFARSIFTKSIEIKITLILLPMLLYTVISIISTFLGILSGNVVFRKAIFYLLKYSEYFIIYFLVTQIVETRQQIKTYIILFIITSIIVNLHGYSLIGKVERLYAPFDAPGAEVTPGVPVGSGEANTYGGYLLIVLSLLFCLLCYSELPTTNFLYLFLIIFTLIPFAFTKSRSSYFAFVPMVITIILLTEKKKGLLLGGILLLFALSPVVFPEATNTVVERIKETFAGPVYSEEEAVILGFKVKELSALARVKSWRKAFEEFLPKKPIFGHGVTGVGLVDTQIPLIIGEVGLLGLTVFIWMVLAVFKLSFDLFKTTIDNLYKSLSLCVISSLIALLVQSIGANTFIIIRIMEPFWFLCGLTSIAKIIMNK